MFVLGEYLIQGRRAAEISASVEAAVAHGELEPGQLLPPIRDLAGRLAVNPHTVAAAYRTLRERGVIETAGRRGSRVRRRPVTTSRGAPAIVAPPGARDVSQGNPDPALLPVLTDAFAAAAAEATAHPVLYGQDAVDPDLAAFARAGLDADGVPAGAIAVTSGSLDAIERVLAVRLRPGDAVAVEDPGWPSLLDLVPALGLRAVPMAIDDEGPLPGELEAALAAGVRAVVVTDRAQNPTGAVLGAARAERLRALLAEAPDVLLVEDDHGHAIVDQPLRPLAPAARRWVTVRSVGKSLGPDLRLAVLTGDGETLDRVRGRQRLGPGWVSLLTQRAVLRLWTSGVHDDRAVADSYRRRRDALIGALADHGVPATGRSGMNVWVPVPEETGAVTRLLHSGWAVAPGARFRIGAPPGVRITVSGLTSEDMGPLARAVAQAVGPVPARRYE